MPSAATKVKTSARIREMRKLAARVLSDLDAIRAIRFERDNSLGFDMTAGSGANEFLDSDASELGFSSVGDMQTLENACLDAADSAYSDYATGLLGGAGAL